MFGPRATGNTRDQRIGIGFAEEGGRIAFASGAVDDAVRVGNVDVVGPAHHRVADVADERARHRLDRDPLAVATAHFEAAVRVLREQCHAAVIRVRPRAVERAVEFAGMRRIVQHAQRRYRPVVGGREIVRVLAKIDGDRAMNQCADHEQTVEVRNEALAETRQARPLVVLATHVERLFRVARPVRVEFFERHPCIAEIVRRTFDGNLTLDVIRQREKCLRGPEEFRDRRFGHAVIADGKEADVARRCADLRRDACEAGFRAVAQGLQIDDGYSLHAGPFGWGRGAPVRFARQRSNVSEPGRAARCLSADARRRMVEKTCSVPMRHFYRSA